MTDESLFSTLRPRLLGLAYRMLGSTGEAEDIVQDTWLRWRTSPTRPDNPEAFLVTICTRLAIDRLRAVKSSREAYPGYWLPEPLLADSPPTPEQLVERADDLSVAFMTLLERLTPEARAAFLMREVFDAGYDELARVIGKSEAACRQLVSRARTQLADGRRRFRVAPDAQHRLVASFAQAMNRGDLGALTALLADDAELISDGGGKVPSFGKPLLGADRIARLFYAGHRRNGDALLAEPVLINGQWGLLRFFEGALESAQSYETDGHTILRIHVQRNPDKLRHLA